MKTPTPAQLDRLDRRTHRELTVPLTFGLLVGAVLFVVFGAWEALLGSPELVERLLAVRAGVSVSLATLAFALQGPLRRFPLAILHVSTAVTVFAIGLLAQVLPEPALFTAGSLMLVLLVHAGLLPNRVHALGAAGTVVVGFHLMALAGSEHLERSTLAVDFFLVPGALTLVGLVELRARARVRAFALELELEAQATEDSLTGVLSRRGFLAAVEAMVRPGEEVGLLVLDLDHFKSINDRHGHAVGDAALRAATSAWRGALRERDLVGRLGGEEFAVALPATGGATLQEIAERLRELTSQTSVDGAPGLVVTTSVGVTSLQYGEALATALARADRALYRAKHAGRNRVELASDEAPHARVRLGQRVVLVKAS